MFKHLKPGDKVFFVPTERYSKPSYKTVAKVGRDWVYFEGRGRFDIMNGVVDNEGRGWCDKVYLTEQEYVDVCNLNKTWQSVCAVFDGHNRPSRMTMDKLLRIEAILEE